MSTFVQQNSEVDDKETILKNVCSDVLEKRDKIASLLEIAFENQQFLKKEVTEELKNNHTHIREEIGYNLRKISDKIDRDVNFAVQNLKSVIGSDGLLLQNNFKSSVNYAPSNEGQLVVMEPFEINRMYMLATKLLEGHCTLRQEIFHQMQLENQQIRKEIKELVRRSEEDIKNRLHSFEQKVEQVMSYLISSANQFHELSAKMDQILSLVDEKVAEVENKLESVATSSGVLFSTLMNRKPTEISSDGFYLSSMSSVRTDLNSIFDDASSVCSFRTDASSCLQDLKEFVTRQNRKLLSPSPESIKYGCKNTCTCYQDPLKIDEKLKMAWDAEAVKMDYDEKFFWSTMDTYLVSYIEDVRLNAYIKTLIILSVTVQTKMDFYNLVTFCATQLRNPSCLGSLAIAFGNEGTTLPEPYIDWSTIFADSDKIFASLSEEEQQFIEKVMAMPEEPVAVWGTAYACLLLRLHDSGPVYVADKLKKLNEELASVYEMKVDEFPAIPQCDQFFDRLQVCSNYELEKKARDTVYKGMIERYESFETTTSTKQLLNFLLLKSLRYKGMPLLTLTDQVVKLYSVELMDLMQSTSFCKTIDSWKTFYQFVFSATYRKYKKWKYCFNFNSEAFPQLRFDANRMLCSILSGLIDLYNVKNKRSKILYSLVIKENKPEWALDKSDTKYLKTSLKLLQKFAKKSADNSVLNSQSVSICHCKREL